MIFKYGYTYSHEVFSHCKLCKPVFVANLVAIHAASIRVYVYFSFDCPRNQ